MQIALPRCRAAVVTVAILAATVSRGVGETDESRLAEQIARDTTLIEVQESALNLMRTGLNAGGSYKEIWIRDLNTFIELALAVQDHRVIRDTLLTFFEFQTRQGEIVDSYGTEPAGPDFPDLRAPSRPELFGHKNTAASDQESSLVQALAKFVEITGDRSILKAEVNEKPISDRLDLALQFLATERYSDKYNLVWGGTRVDWGDVQPESIPGIYLDKTSHRACGVYDNAMFLIAIQKLLGLEVLSPERAAKWWLVQEKVRQGVRTHLWDAPTQKFLPHVYLDQSPFPREFNENAVWYHGGTAVAIAAGLLDRDEVRRFNEQLLTNQRACGAPSIGLTIYPPYPAELFKNPIMRPYGYQNGGDWSWFGARMVEQLVDRGFIREAYEEFKPIIGRARNREFFEWYDLYNRPQGAAHYRGSAGVIYNAINALQRWSRSHLPPASDYEPGTIINFARNGNSARFTRWGWSHAEQDFTWTEGRSAAFAVHMRPAEQPLELQIVMAGLTKPPEITSQPVAVYINEQHVADWNVSTVAPFKCDVPRELNRTGGTLTVELRIPNNASPESLKLGPDSRYLGVCCVNAALSPKASAASPTPRTITHSSTRGGRSHD